MRQFQFRVGYDNFALIHVSLVPDMHGEQKTKPTQTTVHSLRGLGLLPDLVCSYSMMRIKTHIFFLHLYLKDCLPPPRRSTAQCCNESEDKHVLPRGAGASFGCA
jgi:hypothetical protein